MYDRCDTDPIWFLFATCGKPFFMARNEPQALRLFKSERRRHLGCVAEQRSGNYAAATIDELLKTWTDPKIVSAPDGSFVYVAPQYVLEEA